MSFSKKYCIVSVSATELKIPEGDNKKRAVCTVCGHIHYHHESELYLQQVGKQKLAVIFSSRVYSIKMY